MVPVDGLMKVLHRKQWQNNKINLGSVKKSSGMLQYKRTLLTLEKEVKYNEIRNSSANDGKSII